MSFVPVVAPGNGYGKRVYVYCSVWRRPLRFVPLSAEHGAKASRSERGRNKRSARARGGRVARARNAARRDPNPKRDRPDAARPANGPFGGARGGDGAPRASTAGPAGRTYKVEDGAPGRRITATKGRTMPSIA